MRIKFNKEIEFFFKKNFLPQKYLLKKRLERSIKNNDENELKLVKKFIKPDTDTIDVGVYRGVYSYEMSKYSNYVHAFEPNPIIFKDINKNLKKIINNINLYNFALSNVNKIIDLKIPIRNKKYDKSNYEEYFQMGKATIHNENEIDEFEIFKVKTKKLDDLNFNKQISFIKIDVEGHETEVIKGSENTIKINKPILLVEIEEQYTHKKVLTTINYIKSLGYNCFFYQNNELKNTNDLNDLNLFNNYIFKPI
tara:strand:- start:515 stop:1270 length:756 start_codon:yes stop_codon:yes gene_type:complete